MKRRDKIIVWCMTAILGSTSVLMAETVRKPVVIEGKQSLPLRVLTRPFSSIYQNPDEASAMIQENVDAFQPFYVYTRPIPSDLEEDTLWYEVGSDNRGHVLGWMKADDVMEWKQAMCLAYTHPEGRNPVMMFKKHDDLANLAASDIDERESQAAALYEALDAGAIPDEFPLISVEPKRAVFMFIEDQFYLLPIIEHEEVEIDGREGRLLKLAAATSAKAGRGATTVADQEFIQQATTATEGASRAVKDLKIDLIYVIDLTTSMQPYIDATKNAVKAVAEEIAGDPDLNSNVRMGLWGFRDSTDIQGMKFITKNFTPELVDASSFVSVMDDVKAANVGSKGYAEDVFSGVDKALSESMWGDGTMKFIVLVGDAPSHEKGHKWNASGKGAEELRKLADDTRVNISAVHIKNPKAVEYHDLTEEQFSKLSENRGIGSAGGSSYIDVSSDDMAGFDALSGQMIGVFKETMTQARKKGDVSEVMEQGEVQEEPNDFDVDEDEEAAVKTEAIAAQAREMTSQMVRAALVDWIGKAEGVQAPRDISAWVIDKDLMDPAIPSLEVRVLINKNELDSLRTVLQEIMVAGRRGQIAGDDFFDALQATSATLSVTPEQIRSAATLADTGLIPEFLMDLPYKSRIMSMSNDDWQNWSLDQQDEFLNDLDAKISYYMALHDEPGVWVQLNSGDDPDEYVHPITMEMLP